MRQAEEPSENRNSNKPSPNALDSGIRAVGPSKASRSTITTVRSQSESTRATIHSTTSSWSSISATSSSSHLRYHCTIAIIGAEHPDRVRPDGAQGVREDLLDLLFSFGHRHPRYSARHEDQALRTASGGVGLTSVASPPSAVARSYSSSVELAGVGEAETRVPGGTLG
jgi:hypothetical protein